MYFIYSTANESVPFQGLGKIFLNLVSLTDKRTSSLFSSIGFTDCLLSKLQPVESPQSERPQW